MAVTRNYDLLEVAVARTRTLSCRSRAAALATVAAHIRYCPGGLPILDQVVFTVRGAPM